MADRSLLPRNASELEHLAAQALAQIQRVPIPLRQLYNPELCPLELLPYLAWTFSVDRWDNQWPEMTKRDVVRSAYYIHSHKGTIGSLRRVVEPLGYLIEVMEWWQTEPKGTPGTFALEVGLSDTGITEDAYDELVWLIDDARPVTRHLTELAISVESLGVLDIAVCVYEGEEIDVYPPAPQDIEVTGVLGLSLSIDETDTMDVYP